MEVKTVPGEGSGIVMGCLAPHPPVMIPEVGKSDASQTRFTINGVNEMAKAVKACEPECLIFITPHGNLFADAISFLREPELYGDLGAFGASDVKFKCQNDLDLLTVWERRCLKHGLNIVGIDSRTRYRGVNHNLDHGTMVPMYFLNRAGLNDIPCVVISQAGIAVDELYLSGRCMQEACLELGKRAVVIASGDMSHRLSEEGPYGFNPKGPEFDRRITEILQDGDVMGLLTMPEDLREEAGECGYRSLVMMMGAFDGREIATWIYSYQKPFGIGYLAAAVAPTGEAAPSVYEQIKAEYKKRVNEARDGESPLVTWARQVLEAYVLGEELPARPAVDDPLFEERAGVFVSLKKKGQLRGCIGTFMPTTPNIREEIRENAIAAGTRDPRFDPVSRDELAEIVYSVDVLTTPEPCEREDLDPRVYGVIVRSGRRSGLLLPDLEGVDTVDKQLDIALKKAGIRPGEPYTIERFKVKRYH